MDHSFRFEMRPSLAVLGFFLAYVAANSFEDHAPYGFYPYYFNPYYSPNRLWADELRTLALGMGGGFTAAVPRPTVTNIRIVTATVTCSLSVTNRCAARQVSEFVQSGIVEQSARPGRPAVASTSGRDEEKDDIDEQFSIDPSAVQEVEATQLPAREARAADQQWLVMSPKFDYRAQEIQSAFHSDPHHLPVAVPFNRRYVPVQQRQFGIITNLFTVTKMGTSFHVKTSTLVPSCSAAGKLLQCPNGK